MTTELQTTYQTLANRYQNCAKDQKQRLQILSFFRFISFIGIFAAFYFLYPLNSSIAAIAAVLFLICFLLLVKIFIATEKKRNYFIRLSEINQLETEALNRNFSHFDPGNEFIDTHHDYSYDLDLYGPGSMFQFLNRTVTQRGKKQLSALLNQTKRTAEEIAQRQNCIQELAADLDWRQQFQAKGFEIEDEKTLTQTESAVNQQIKLKSAVAVGLLLKILPPVTVLLIGLSIFGLTEKSYFLIPVFAQWALFLIYSRTISTFQKQFEGQAKVLDRYAVLLEMIENMPFTSSHLVSIKEKLRSKGKTASSITAQLHNILAQFDYRLNIIVGILLNSVFLWDIRCLMKMHNWQTNYSGEMAKWFDTIGETDALISLANCNYNHPKWSIPLVSGKAFHFSANEMGHPLIAEHKCVTNTFQISGNEQIVIITGANMAGKSTFLRTVGINLVLAANGCKVFASEFTFSPMRIFTHMRTSDNLLNDESYFYAELLRLQTMLNAIRSGEQLIVIVDEMLKGTNSVDKLNGSKELVKQLISLKTRGIVATHDLNLTELSHDFPEEIKNQCFEVNLNQEELSFDYKLTAGVTRTMNATFLMKQMGIIPGTQPHQE